MTRVCIIIPAYNESRVIGDVVRETIASLKKSAYECSVLVINDASTDDTSATAQSAGALVINHILNTGAGGATATGLEYALKHNFDVAATMDADGQHDIMDVLNGIKLQQKTKNDLLIGSRLMDPRGMSRTKQIGNWGLSVITFVLFGVRSTDSQSGLRIYSKRAIENLRWRTSGYEFCSEMLWRAHQLRLSISEYPIKAIYTDYSRSKGQNNWNAVNIIKTLIQRRITELLR